MDSNSQQAVLNPFQWGSIISAPPVLTSDSSTLRRGLLRRWADTSPEMKQPALDHHVAVLHLGGAKRVRRDRDGDRTITDVHSGGLTIIAAGSASNWRTEGPVDFSHLYIRPRDVDRVVVEVFDREPLRVAFLEEVGRSDALVEGLLNMMMLELSAPVGPSGFYLETLFHAALVRLVGEHSTLSTVHVRAPHSLAPFRLRRVLDYIGDNLSGDISLAALSEVSGLSRYHFSRAFQRMTGLSPYAFVISRRIERAKRLMADHELPIAGIAKRCGFNSHGQFSTMFKRITGLKPSRWRDEH
ncbi:MAG TPA: AraC family transcriptional regulator [Caulobacteraceae bacterium]